jgi:hypothetical protein
VGLEGLNMELGLQNKTAIITGTNNPPGGGRLEAAREAPRMRMR